MNFGRQYHEKNQSIECHRSDMLRNFICLLLLSRFVHSSTLVCPEYSSYQQDLARHRFIRRCEGDCTFRLTSGGDYACLGIYQSYAGEILIRQLGIIRSDKQCSTDQKCLLQADPLNPQVFSCCCSTSNCTLTWATAPTTASSTFTPSSTWRSHSSTTSKSVASPVPFSWELFLIVFICILSAVLIAFTVNFFKSLRTRQQEKNHRSMERSSSIENLFFSAQQLVLGQNSIIYKALFHDQTVALKVYQPTHVLVWTNEMMILKSIQHESIIKLLCDGQYDNHLYLVLPFHEHGTLQSYLRAPYRTLTMHQSLLFLRSLASAVSYLHLGRNTTGMPIVHRDIKSSNILVHNNGLSVYLADFGMAAALSHVLTEKDFVQIGTMRYMAPELLEGVIAHTREALFSVDIYAVALVMWEIISQCDAYANTVYRAPYDEYLTNPAAKSSFAIQLYDIVVTRHLRPSLIRPLKDAQHAAVIHELCTLVDACWVADSDLRINAQTLAFKLDQIKSS